MDSKTKNQINQAHRYTENRLVVARNRGRASEMSGIKKNRLHSYKINTSGEYNTVLATDKNTEVIFICGDKFQVPQWMPEPYICFFPQAYILMIKLNL